MKSLSNPQTLEEFFDLIDVDESVRPLYRKWLIAIVLRKMPKKQKDGKNITWDDEQVFAYNEALSDISDRIKEDL